MAKTKKRSRKASKKVDIKSTAIKVASMCAGVAVGSFINKFFGEKSQKVAGLDGDTADYVAPILTGAAGVLGMSMSKSQLLKDASLGITVAGGAAMINKIAGKTVVALSGADDYKPLPGFAGDSYVALPQFPDNNAIATHYNPDLQPVGGFGGDDVINGVKQVEII